MQWHLTLLCYGHEVSALESFQQTVGGLHPIEFPFWAFSEIVKNKQTNKKPKH